MKVGDAVTSRKPLTIGPEDSWDLARQVMGWSGVRHLPVMRGQTLVGLVSERDLLSHSGDPARHVSEFMTTPVHTVNADAELSDARFLMGSEKIGCLPVLSGGALVGVLTTTDVLQIADR